MQLTTSLLCQINISWVFELIIGGITAFEVTLLSYLDKWFVSCYQDSDGAPLLHLVRLIEENYYCVVMSDWKATVKVLQDNKTFISHFGPNLTPPRLLYQVNSDSSFKQVQYGCKGNSVSRERCCEGHGGYAYEDGSDTEGY